MKPTTHLPTPDFLIVRVTRQDEELLFHTHGGTVHEFPAGSVSRCGTTARPGVSVRDPEAREVYSAPLTRDALAQLAVCLHGDGMYAWLDTQAFGPSVPVTAWVYKGQVVSYVTGAGETALTASPAQIREGQVAYVNGLYTALRLACRFAHLGAEPVSFTPAPVPFQNETLCDSCGLPTTGDEGEQCPTCQAHEQAWNAALDDLRGRLSPVLDHWAAHWAGQGLQPVDLSSAVEMGLGILKGQRLAGF
ncbi:hypothetical protein DEIPH_ctg021orf0073 [Deinococcus phoenicis]|uniref:Uncharacterized protein n=1 Tax=Deinococcus phoenicis TaxID=1476583 RepID=A0A016QR28_9DEIO|nr:hypothetical protein [Deinococcus phoenicis]EYB68555.1 hypothetical protein DEIPH_ctg021orf0073 [Deinococcus phoenicis]